MLKIRDLQFERVGSDRKVSIRQGISDCVATLQKASGKLTLGTACSGTDVIVHIVADLLAPLWKASFGICLEVEHSFACELVHWKRDWILAHFNPRFLFEDLLMIGEDTAFDIRSGKMQSIPSVVGFACGIECDTLSGLNQNQDLECVETATGKTGTTFEGCRLFVERHQPWFFLFENIKNLGAVSNRPASASSSQPKSALQLIAEWANSQGYLVQTMLLDCSDFGVPQSRPRYYILGFKVAPPNSGLDQSVESFSMPPWFSKMSSLVNEMQVPQQPVKDFLLPQSAHCTAEPARQDPTSPSKKQKGEKSYEVEHLCKYESCGLTWPPVFSQQFIEKVHGMTQRKKELIHYYQQCLVTADIDDQEECYLDINMSIGWVRPRSGMLPCIVSSSHIWQLHACKEITGEELLCLQGFSHQLQATVTPPACGKIFTQVSKIDLAGNAFNGAVLMAVLTAALSTYPWSHYMTKHIDADETLDDDGFSIETYERDENDSNDLDDLLLS